MPARWSLCILLVALFAVVQPIRADFYRCQHSGRVWVTNNVSSGMRGRCRLLIRSAPADGEPSVDTGVARHKSTKDFVPVIARATETSSSSHAIDTLIAECAQRYSLPHRFVRAIMRIESNFYPRATSRVGAMGLMQLMPQTAASLGVSDPYDPRQNVMGGCKLLRMLANRFGGDIVRTLAAYHAGHGAVESREGVPFVQTDLYVRMVLAEYYKARATIPFLLSADPVSTEGRIVPKE